MVRKPPSFLQNSNKKCGNYILCLEGGLVSLKTCSEEGLADFYHQIKVLQQIRREDSIQAVRRRMRRLEEFLYEVATNFELSIKFQKSKFENLKHTAVNVLSNGITFRLLAGTVYLQCVKQMEKGIKKQPKLRPTVYLSHTSQKDPAPPSI